MKVKVLDAQRRPHWVGEGDIVPAGWYFASGERMSEPYRVVRIIVEPDEGPIRERLGFEPARLQAERAPVEAANAAGREAAAELNARLRAAGISPAALEFTWHVPITVDGSPIVGRMVASGLAVGEVGEKEVGPDEVDGLIEKAQPVQAELDAKYRRKAIVEAVKAAGEAAGYPAGKMVKHRGEWRGHDDAFGGLAGGDFTEWEEWEWAAWAKRAIVRAEKGEDVSAVCADEIARAKAADKAASELAAEIRQAVERGLLMVGRWSAQGRMALISRRRLVEWWPKVPSEAWVEDPRWKVPLEVLKASARIRRRLRAADRLARMHPAFQVEVQRLN